MKPILAVIVLYRMRLSESPTWRELTEAFLARPELADAIDLLVADNSPEPQVMPAGFQGVYLHDGQNPGLSRRYNQALALAKQRGQRWLLLFDQDTRPTAEYFSELVEVATRIGSLPNSRVVAIAPKLKMDGRIMSPHGPRFLSGNDTIVEGASGVFDGVMRVYNSGALLSVRALGGIEGFPEAYWLDYLDHATFHRLQQAGGQVYMLRATLAHDLASARSDAQPDPERLLNRLRAEHRFYDEYGTWRERFWHQIDLLRQVVGWGRRGQFTQAGVRLRVLLHLG